MSFFERKMLMLSLIMLLSLTIISCGNKNSEAQNEVPTEDPLEQFEREYNSHNQETSWPKTVYFRYTTYEVKSNVKFKRVNTVNRTMIGKFQMDDMFYGTVVTYKSEVRDYYEEAGFISTYNLTILYKNEYIYVTRHTKYTSLTGVSEWDSTKTFGKRDFTSRAPSSFGNSYFKDGKLDIEGLKYNFDSVTLNEDSILCDDKRTLGEHHNSKSVSFYYDENYQIYKITILSSNMSGDDGTTLSFYDCFELLDEVDLRFEMPEDYDYDIIYYDQGDRYTFFY